MNIYVASSWRNPFQQNVVKILREQGHEVYDFKNPGPGDSGFHWREVDGGYESWTPQQYRSALNHPIAKKGYLNDFRAMMRADACVLVLPCGRSAHLEAGHFAGAGKLLFILLMDERVTKASGHSMDKYAPCSRCDDLDGCHLASAPQVVPELMYMMATDILCTKEELLTRLRPFVDARPNRKKT